MTIFVFFVLVQWQQSVSYEINAKLDTDEHGLAAVELLTYRNNSPLALDTLYLYLHANAYKDGNTYYAQSAAKLGDKKFVKAKPGDRGYISVNRVLSDGDALDFVVDETIMRIPMPQTLASGDSIMLHIDYYLKIPGQFPRLGNWSGHYKMVEWYPKVCVFDEAGWHLDPIHPLDDGAYGEFGAYDVTIDLPGNYVVAGTGTQVEPSEKEFLDHLIATGTKLDRRGRKTVRFLAENVHDFAWVCDSNFVVEEYEVNSTKILAFRRKKDGSWANAGSYAVNAVSRYNEWFAEYPHACLNLVQSYGGDGATYPQMVIMTTGDDPVTRLFEGILVDKICLQWFNGILGLNGITDAWFCEGLSLYAAIRYMEDKYGEDNSIIRTSILPPLSLRYYHRFYYYLVQTNQLEKPITTPASEYFDAIISYDNNTQSKPALFFLNLESICSREKFDAVLREYFNRYAYKHSRVDDYVSILERQTEKNFTQLFVSLVTTTDFCDWKVKGVEDNTVVVVNNGDLRIPVDVHITAEEKEHVYTLDATEKSDTIIIPEESGKIKRVAIDPAENLMDPNYWNNYSPRRIKIKPIWAMDLPSYSAYQFIWTPWLWYNDYDGIIFGFHSFGDKFADFDFIKGGNQLKVSYTYGTSSKRGYPSVSFQTPLFFDGSKRVRILGSFSRSRSGEGVSFGFTTKLGQPFSIRPQIWIDNLITYHSLNSYSGVDSIDWDLGRNVVFSNIFRYRFKEFNLNAMLGLALHGFGGDWQYFKAVVEAKQDVQAFIPFSARVFAGEIFGTPPTHELIFLSGAMKLRGLAGALFSQSGTMSPQERLHIPADGNMRGYQTLHIKSDRMYTLNLEFPNNTLVRAFVDVGYYNEFAFDTGLRLVIGAESFPFLPLYGLSISLNVPLYTYTPGEPWKLRWSLGFYS